MARSVQIHKGGRTAAPRTIPKGSTLVCPDCGRTEVALVDVRAIYCPCDGWRRHGAIRMSVLRVGKGMGRHV